MSAGAKLAAVMGDQDPETDPGRGVARAPRSIELPTAGPVPRLRWRRTTVIAAATGLFSQGLLSERAYVALTLTYLVGELLERLAEAFLHRPTR